MSLLLLIIILLVLFGGGAYLGPGPGYYGGFGLGGVILLVLVIYLLMGHRL